MVGGAMGGAMKPCDNMCPRCFGSTVDQFGRALGHCGRDASGTPVLPLRSLGGWRPAQAALKSEDIPSGLAEVGPGE